MQSLTIITDHSKFDTNIPVYKIRITTTRYIPNLYSTHGLSRLNT